MNDIIHDYLLKHIPESSPFFVELEKYAKENEVPIMERDSLYCLLQILDIQKPQRILELGTAIGYSALKMADKLPGAEIISVERDEERYKQAIHNIERYGAADRVKVLLTDAIEGAEEISSYGPFDAIFIDAAKAQYEKFFHIYTNSLAPDGVIYSDNVLFKGLALDMSPEKQRKLRVARKMRHFNDFLVTHPDFETTTIPLGDGLSISKRRKTGGVS
ncbi:O-methyltransferase [Listeria ivanovii]|uniref:tRNA 5-hydroxyuridine methyltransferase n=1 Tax=Listeria ivanovii (strain ATCC BAA-678 / PAM 55) TaxID=881621 RepID=G2Z942_LISIP|nr:O-methyltransferase [Listeria ivanovii]AHI55994.1 O-methyltransferase [Listeria ivanovii WSLC3009]AIS65434.1 SAM-dependent methyltransferase [Listeria ivanovii subsp. ivanovii]MBC1759345.1 O-methyltransferase [Listeria ivanovii]MCJ1717435.1 O-methyltransferase [Listeria ivanovii]MCJ1722801.1 O-methyltransferase [Listeria ivanovii]